MNTSLNLIIFMNLNFFSKKIKNKMKRHDTHLLSDESEKENKGEDAHQYNFSNCLSDSYNSQDNYISKKENKKSPIKLNLEENNFKNEKKDENSIISSSELEDLFQGEKKNNSVEKTKKKIKPKKNKLFVKLKKINLNKEKDDDLVEDCLTFSPSPRYDNMFEKDFINLRTTKFKKQKNDKNEKNEEKKINPLTTITERKLQDNNNIANKKNSIINKESKENEILYFFYNDDNEGDKKLKKVINIINKEKSQLFKISNKNCFTIKNTNFSNNSSRRVKYTNPSQFIDKYKNTVNDKYKIKKDRLNYSAKNALYARNNKGNNILKEDNKCSNLNMSLQNYNKFNNYRQSLIDNYNKNCSREKILYGLYCNKMDNSINSLKKQRIKSTDSLINKRQKYKLNKNVSNILERDDYFPEEIRYMEIHEREKENRKIIKGMFRKAGHNFNDFSRHVGNDANCPICQAMQMKNENNIKVKGICPIISSINNNHNNTQNSWQNRRIYSALSRVLTKKQIDRSGNKNSNLSNVIKMRRNKNINKNLNNLNDLSRIKSRKENNDKKDFDFRKLNFNRAGVNQNKFPKSNKIMSFKNTNIKYN